MINSKNQLIDCLKKEKKIYFPNGGFVLPFGIREKDILYKYQYFLRKAEYCINTKKKCLSIYYKIRLKKMQMKYGIHIEPNVCGEGLSIAHVGPIIINRDVIIGNNLRIHVGVNIGADEKGGTPHIGDDVYIGPGAKIFGAIRVANKCKVGANAVVNKSCLTDGTTLVGIPAQEIKKL